MEPVTAWYRKKVEHKGRRKRATKTRTAKA
jgi:hypothetical protein